MKPLTATRRRLLICLLLTLVTLVIYWPVRHFAFVNFDDDLYVYENVQVKRGLTWDGLRWALTNRDTGHWHPLTWLSLMVDAEWHGLNAGGYHLTNLLLHTANTVLLFLVLTALTGATWPSAWVAALFALHPLHVESVAWVTERKDVLSGLFWMLTLGAYLRYVRTSSGTWYGLTMLSFALGLMAKPMLVTLPFVLLLLDEWPLRRRAGVAWWQLIREKLPLFLLAIVSCGITWAAARPAQASLDWISPGQRVATAVVGYAAYLHKMIWPTGLAFFYPHPWRWPAATVVMAVLVVASLTGLAWWTRRRQPALWLGWWWYVGTLVPVIGLVQVGGQALADRYTYLPLIGVWIALAWSLTESTTGRPAAARTALAVAGAVTVAACAWLTSRQVLVWRDGITLFRHALLVTENNAVAENGLGQALLQAGRIAEAIPHYQRAVEIFPGYALAHYNLGIALHRAAQVSAAIHHFEQALRLNPRYAEAHYELGLALEQTDRAPEAVAHYEHAVRLNPRYSEAHNNLGVCRARGGQMDVAIRHFREAVRFKPANQEAGLNLGLALAQTGQQEEAIHCLEDVVRRNPRSAATHQQLGLLLEQAHRSAEAQAHFAEARRLDPTVGGFR